VITDSHGNPLTGTHSLTFKLYDVETGGTPLWTETHTSVAFDSSGHFDVMLGSINPLNVSFDRQLWLEISVDRGAPMSPRLKLAAAAYSLSSVNQINSVTPDTSGKIRLVAGGGIGIRENPLDHSIEISASASADTGLVLGGSAARGNGYLEVRKASDNLVMGIHAVREADDTLPIFEMHFADSATRKIDINAPVYKTMLPFVYLTGFQVENNFRGEDNFNLYGIAGVVSDSSLTNSEGIGVLGKTKHSIGDFYTGCAAGVAGISEAPDDVGGYSFGVAGYSEHEYSAGVLGYSVRDSGRIYGVWGNVTITNKADSAAAVLGEIDAQLGNVAFGIWGTSNSPTQGSAGILGIAKPADDTGEVYGVEGITYSKTDWTAGVRGRAESFEGIGFGVMGITDGDSGSAGVFGIAERGSLAVGYGPEISGVKGFTQHYNNSYGVYGIAIPALGESGVARVYGVKGLVEIDTSGWLGMSSDSCAGVLGEVDAPKGVSFGVMGITDGDSGSAGVYGKALKETEDVYGVYGITNGKVGSAGVYGEALNDTAAVFGVYGVTHSSDPFAAGVMGRSYGDSSFAILGIGNFAICETTDYYPILMVKSDTGEVIVYGELSIFADLSGHPVTVFGGPDKRVAIQKVNGSATPTLRDNNFTIEGSGPIVVTTGTHGVTISCPDCCTSPCGGGGGTCTCSEVTVGNDTTDGKITVRGTSPVLKTEITPSGQFSVNTATGDSAKYRYSEVEIENGNLTAKVSATEGLIHKKSGRPTIMGKLRVDTLTLSNSSLSTLKLTSTDLRITPATGHYRAYMDVDSLSLRYYDAYNTIQYNKIEMGPLGGGWPYPLIRLSRNDNGLFIDSGNRITRVRPSSVWLYCGSVPNRSVISLTDGHITIKDTMMIGALGNSELTSRRIRFQWGAKAVTIYPEGGVVFETGEGITRRPDGSVNASFDELFASIITGTNLSISGTKSFVAPHPEQPDKMIQFYCSESDEVTIFHRGVAELVNGYAEIKLPHEFILMAEPGTYSVNCTPQSPESKGIAARVENGKLKVWELNRGNGSYKVSYIVFATRKGYKDYPVIVPKSNTPGGEN